MTHDAPAGAFAVIADTRQLLKGAHSAAGELEAIIPPRSSIGSPLRALSPFGALVSSGSQGADGAHFTQMEIPAPLRHREIYAVDLDEARGILFAMLASIPMWAVIALALL